MANKREVLCYLWLDVVRKRMVDSDQSDPTSSKKDSVSPPMEGDESFGNSTSNSNKRTSSSEASHTSGTLDFAKREVNPTSHPNSHSALSTLSRRARRTMQHSPGTGASPNVSPPLISDDREKIRNPASALPSRKSSLDIGLRFPFGDGGKKPVSPGRKESSGEVLPRVSTALRSLRNYAPAHAVLTRPSSPTDEDSGSPNNQQKSPTDSLAELHLPRGRKILLRPSSDDLSRTQILRKDPVLRQLRGPRHPIYIPAVLRPTLANSYNPSRSASAVPANVLQPLRRHWASNESTSSCVKCHRAFGLLRRRHHCRKCGGIFCAADSSHTIGLDGNLNFNLFGRPVRSCDGCYVEFAQFATDIPRLDPSSSQIIQTSQSAPSQPQDPSSGHAPPGLSIPVAQQGTSDPTFAGSVIQSGDWSTF